MPGKRASCFVQILLALFSLPGLEHTVRATTERIIHNFQPSRNGLYPSALVGDGTGNFYGVASGGTHNLGILYKVSPDSQRGWTYVLVHNFTHRAPAILVSDAAGNLYGTTLSGGSGNCYLGCGTAVKLSPDSHGGWTDTVIYNFPQSTDGSVPTGVVALDQAGNLYGTTSNYGSTGTGVVFELSPSATGWTESILHAFSGGTDGAFLYSLVLDQSGDVYGTTESGGSANFGTVFELTPAASGWTKSVLYSFATEANGIGPTSLLFDPSGNLYGSTVSGGNPSCGSSGTGCGLIFRLSRVSGGQWTETVLYSLNFAGNWPTYPAVSGFDSEGNLYGTSTAGSTASTYCGIIFQLTPGSDGTWTESTIWNFTRRGCTSGTMVVAGSNHLVGTSGGVVSGITGALFDLSFAYAQWNLNIFHSFIFSDGASPLTSLTADSSGNLYGTTNLGGDYDLGAVFKMTPHGNGDWQESTIYSFQYGSANGVNGVFPSSLILDGIGNVYGATAYGGPINRAYGSVFEVSPTSKCGWSEKDLIRFSGVIDHPLGNLISDKFGNLYGTTLDGGASAFGSVYELSPQANGTWTQTVIYSFNGYPNDGANPGAGLVMDGGSNLYGTTERGGNSNCMGVNRLTVGCGTVFELHQSPGGVWKEHVLYSFLGSATDGAFPSASLIFDADGNLFGTTQQGGIKSRRQNCFGYQAPPGCGTVFELSLKNGVWTESVLHEFSDSSGDGRNPVAGLLMDKTGNLYGTTTFGGSSDSGTVFKLAPDGSGGWTESVMYSFSGTDGQYPSGGLIMDGGGNLYGTTGSGGSVGSGTVFELTP